MFKTRSFFFPSLSNFARIRRGIKVMIWMDDGGGMGS